MMVFVIPTSNGLFVINVTLCEGQVNFSSSLINMPESFEAITLSIDFIVELHFLFTNRLWITIGWQNSRD